MERNWWKEWGQRKLKIYKRFLCKGWARCAVIKDRSTQVNKQGRSYLRQIKDLFLATLFVVWQFKCVYLHVQYLTVAYGISFVRVKLRKLDLLQKYTNWRWNIPLYLFSRCCRKNAHNFFATHIHPHIALVKKYGYGNVLFLEPFIFHLCYFFFFF